MKRITFLLLSLLLFLRLIPICPAEEAQLPEAVEQVRQSLVHLYGMGTDLETGQRTRWSGTGFAVGTRGEDSDIFLTNWHVATGSGKFVSDQVELWILKDEAQFGSDYRPLPGCGVKCRVLITTDGYPDVAVIQALEPVAGYKALPLRPSKLVPEGSTAYALGFPGLKGTRNGLDSGAEDAIITKGTVRDHLVMSRAGNSQAVIHSAAIQRGFSGGPLVDDQGVVVAQNAYGFEEEVTTELFCAVYTEYAMELLEQLDIPYDLADSPSPVTALMAKLLHMPRLEPVPAYLLFALALVLALGSLLLFIKALIAVLRVLLQQRTRRLEEWMEWEDADEY